jgi:transaldolase
MRPYPHVELIWASPREVLNLFHAEIAGCHVITMTHDLLNRLSLIGRDLQEYSLDTVKMFYEDGKKAGYDLMKIAAAAAGS